ncbi:MAG: hypothetical protein AAF404_16040, partial [Pseudomonadota bacterium]
MHFQRSLKKLLLLAGVSIACSASAVEQGQPTGRLIVELRADSAVNPSLGALQGDRKSTDSTEPQRWASQRGLHHHRGIDRQTHLMTPAKATRTEDLRYLAQTLASSEGVVSASVEYRRFPLLEPNDPLYRGPNAEPGTQSYMYDGEFSLRAPGAWDITTGASTSVIAVVDTGVISDHPDLRGR